jgi:glycosyltransferase involved in cell wall biosynthesis
MDYNEQLHRIGIDMKNSPLVSVIMNCYNGERYLREAIDSIYAQTYTNWEIIFWDNFSTDASASIVRSYGEQVKYHKGESLVPLYEARNLALEHCQGDVVAFLDCDDAWLPNKLNAQIEQYKQGYHVIYGGYQIIDGEGKCSEQVARDTPSGWLTKKLIRRNSISIGAIMVDRCVLQAYRFDPTYNLLGDFDLWIRLSHKYPFGTVSEVVELSRQHGANLSHQLKGHWLKERRYFYRKFLRYRTMRYFPDIFIYILRAELKGLLHVY